MPAGDSTKIAEAYDRIAARLLSTAPHDIPERKQLLEDLIELMPKPHRLEKQLAESLCLLYRHEILQRELPLRFTRTDAKDGQ